MLLKSRFDYPTIDRVTHDDGTRFYTCPQTGNPLPSVTTILSGTADKTALKEWAKAVGEKRANRAKEEGTAIGSVMHLHIENHIAGIERPRGNHPLRMMAARMADQIIEHGLKHVDEVWGMEVGMYWPNLYAGTTDLVGLYKGKPAIMDHKSAKKMRSREMIDDYMDQLCAYALAHNEVYGTEIEMGVVFMCARDLKFEQFILEGDEFKRHMESFLIRLDAFLTNPQPLVA